MLRRIPRAWLLAAPAIFCLYLSGLSSTGLLGPDEPRYAAIGREMARSGDWVTPRLWGEPWFEKPALLYWMIGGAFRLGLGDNLAPRLPVALLAIAFLVFYQVMLARHFGERASWYATAILATSAGWLAYSQVGVTDLPMSAAFAAAMLLGLSWLKGGDTRSLPAAAALLGVSVLAKGLVPLVLVLPLLWVGRKRILDVLRPRVLAAFILVAAPWYIWCYASNGAVFLETFFWEHHFGRFASGALQHHQPFWFYLPVLLAAMLPWSSLLVLLGRRELYRDPRARVLLTWLLFGFLFFSVSTNKLPGYLLPLLPAAAALMGLALAHSARAAILASCAAMLTLLPVAAAVIPRAVAAGLSRADLPAFEWAWLLLAVLAAAVWWLERSGRRVLAFGALSLAGAAGFLYVKVEAYPALDRAASARPLWRAIAPVRDEVCISQINRAWRYGLNYYAVDPLPDCSAEPRPLRVEQQPGKGPFILRAPG